MITVSGTLGFGSSAIVTNTGDTIRRPWTLSNNCFLRVDVEHFPTDLPVGTHWNRKVWRLANLGKRKVNLGTTLTLLSFEVAVPWRSPSVETNMWLSID
jgi:hypothetical protein